MCKQSFGYPQLYFHYYAVFVYSYLTYVSAFAETEVMASSEVLERDVKVYAQQLISTTV